VFRISNDGQRQETKSAYWLERVEQIRLQLAAGAEHGSENFHIKMDLNTALTDLAEGMFQGCPNKLIACQ
jgi:hypothetical protein